jgi:hypothetical protein
MFEFLWYNVFSLNRSEQMLQALVQQYMKLGKILLFILVLALSIFSLYSALRAPLAKVIGASTDVASAFNDVFGLLLGSQTGRISSLRESPLGPLRSVGGSCLALAPDLDRVALVARLAQPLQPCLDSGPLQSTVIHETLQRSPERLPEGLTRASSRVSFCKPDLYFSMNTCSS